ncbi:MAG: cupin domain-containing protein [Candidatus Bathyarchaeia archaeon]
MGNFYDAWLKYWDEALEKRQKARKVIHEEELEWVSTRQDKRVALLAAPETGFFTWGGVTMLVEIPVGWRTGKCSGGEVAMYIIEGKGCSVIDGLRYDWEKGAVVWIPFGAVYQHYNLGDKPVRFLAANAIHLERFLGIAKLIQYEDCSEIPEGEPAAPKAPSDILFGVGRIVLHEKDAPMRIATPQELQDAKGKGQHLHLKRIELMGSLGTGFAAKEVQITTIMVDEPVKKMGIYPEKHAHMEAHVYVLEGEGFSIIDGEKIPWKKGSLLHIQGPQTMHEHHNTGETESKMLRIEFGIRPFYEAIAKRTFPFIGTRGHYDIARGATKP